MKKIFLGLTVLASSLTFAQQFRVKAGLNLSDISNTSTAVDTKMKTGLYADGIFSPGRLGSMQKVDKVVPSEEMQRGESTLYSPGKFGEEKTVGSIINDMKGKGRWLSPGKFGEMVG